MIITTDTTAIPLSQLVQGSANVRRTGRSDSIGELAASIRAHGLRQNLNVRAIEGGRFEIVAGGRRLRALKQLAKAKHLPKDYAVPCRVLTEAEDAGEISLAENVVRVAMHPADQFAAFQALVAEKGLTVAEVAQRFGVETGLVERRLKLASLHPKLLTAYRNGDLTLDCLMAFTVSDDHKAQLRVWQDGRRGFLSPHTIRRALTAGAVAASDRLARFIGLDAYMAAGGAIIRDLFDEANDGFLTDSALLMQLVTEKLDALAEAERTGGWRWVKAELEHDYGTRYVRLRSVPFTCDPEDGGDDDAGEDEPGEEPDEADRTEAGFTEEEKARSGVRLRIGPDGTLLIDRGLLRPQDLPRSEPSGKPSRPDPVKGEYAATVVQELTAHRTAALRFELASNPSVALAATVHALALPLLYADRWGSCLGLTALSRALEAGGGLHGPCGHAGDRQGLGRTASRHGRCADGVVPKRRTGPAARSSGLSVGPDARCRAASP